MSNLENARRESIADSYEVVELACGLSLRPERLAPHRARCLECQADDARQADHIAGEAEGLPHWA